jgi:hypothetical protein
MIGGTGGRNGWTTHLHFGLSSGEAQKNRILALPLIRPSYVFLGSVAWGRCYDHNFLRFATIFGEKIGVFLKNQCYDQYFA